MKPHHRTVLEYLALLAVVLALDLGAGRHLQRTHQRQDQRRCDEAGELLPARPLRPVEGRQAARAIDEALMGSSTLPR